MDVVVQRGGPATSGTPTQLHSAESWEGERKQKDQESLGEAQDKEIKE